MKDDLLKRITVEAGKCGGWPCIRGMRIRVTNILQLLSAGAPHEEILEDYPDLERDDILTAIEYAAREINLRQARTQRLDTARQFGIPRAQLLAEPFQVVRLLQKPATPDQLRFQHFLQDFGQLAPTHIVADFPLGKHLQSLQLGLGYGEPAARVVGVSFPRPGLPPLS